MYHVAVDNQIPYMVYSNMQDNGTMRGVHTQPEATGRGGATWEHGIGGCESGFTIPDPADPNIIWATCYGNQVTRYDARTKRARSVSPWLHTLDSPPTDTRYRCHWSPPLAIDPFDHNTGLLRLPDDPAHHQRRHELERIQSRSFDEGSRAHRCVWWRRRR
jgi:hypothetical protein